MTNEELIQKAKSVINPRELTKKALAGKFGCALITDTGNVYLGVNLEAACDIGFCAERNAIGSMLTSGEKNIKTIITIDEKGEIRPPCGACREMMYQASDYNKDTDVIVEENKIMKLDELLPEYWR